MIYVVLLRHRKVEITKMNGNKFFCSNNKLNESQVGKLILVAQVIVPTNFQMVVQDVKLLQYNWWQDMENKKVKAMVQ